MTSVLKSLLRVVIYLLRRKWVSIPLFILFVGYSLVNCATVYVGPAQIGVRQVYFGPHSGLRKDFLHTGIHLVVPTYERVYLYPTDLQSLDMSNHKEGSTSASGRTTNAIRIQTSDGYQVTVDVTVLYRLKDPYLLITKIGPGKLYEDSLVIPRADKALRQALGELNSEQFYQGPVRIQKTKEVFDALQPELADKGIELVKILVRRLTYDQAYQTQIEQRKIQDQTVFKNRAEAAAAKEEAHKREIVSVGQAAVKVELESGQREVAKILADANLLRRSKDADGELLVKTAIAEGTELENRALQGGGAGALVGLRMADVLRGIRVIVLPSTGAGASNPLDVSSTLRQFEVGK